MSAATRKGKQPEGTMTDNQVAFKSFMEELRAADTFLADRRMTRSIQSAIQLDGDALLQSQNEERIAEQDRNLSVSLSKGEREPPAPQSTSLPLAQDEEILEKMACIYITGIDDTESDDDIVVASQPESSAWAASRQVGTARQKRSCEACGEQKHFATLSRAPCQHEYCRECLSQLFRNAIVDESLFPPRCCKQPIPLDKSQLFLDSNVVVQFRRKAVEFSTPNRIYCHNTRCAAFIPASNYSYTTATIENSCRCGFQFCYVCGARWKTCRCDHWVEHRLYERAAQIDARDHVGEEEERHRQARIQTIARDLRENHECDHERWYNREGSRRCEECHDVMPLFIYECRQCHIMACRRCRYHRL
ncbi:hypothetical protein F5Y08DRAFT_315166 [Xylaria arbuscula]|nr:hypothetical protein F5Y08DRAFT_315166 [Xylaria arbuscula]